MTLDYSQWRDSIAERQQSAVSASRPALEFLARAEVAARDLTGQESWDFFLSCLQGMLDRTRQQRETFRETLTNPALVNADAITKARNDVFLADERIRVLEAVIGFPKELIEAGAAAKLRLAEIGDAA